MRLIGWVPFVLLATAACGSVEETPDVLDCGQVAGLVACNTFDAVDPAWTTLEDRGVTALVPDDDGGDGQVLQARVAVGGGKAVRTRAIDAADRYYARLWAKVPAGVDTRGLSLLHVGEPVAPFLGTNVEIAAGMLGVGVQSGEIYDYPAAAPIDRWFCVELELVVSETGGRVVLRADGATVLDRQGIDTRPAGGMGDLEVGLSYVAAEATQGATALVDDVVIAREPLPACDLTR